MQITSEVYNYLSNTAMPKKRTTAHKSSELRAVYNNMAKYNKSLPLYKFSLSAEKQDRVINIKEAALTLKDVAQSFNDKESEVYSKKMLISDNEDSVTGELRGKDIGSLPDSLDIQVKALATNQVNTGEFLPSGRRYFSTGSYNFTMDTLNASLHFNLNIDSADNNYDIQSKIANSINSRNQGITASVITDNNENSALQIVSSETGRPGTADGLYFSFSVDDGNYDIVSDLGLNNVVTEPNNSSFVINGETHAAATNNISVNQVITLDFHSVSDGPVKIQFAPDMDSVMNQVDSFVDAYNNLVDLSDSAAESKIGRRNLFNDISAIVEKHRNELESAGLTISEDNHIVKEESLLVQSLKSGEFAELFNDISSFKDDISLATDRLTLDPMAYINRLIVTYPDTRRNQGTSYNQSVYSGMIYNNYA
ncbi:MAG: flagellar filament capping protein FliD [Lachnospiraceae bacterium]|nr:flagellar filament capping protein FliD [Lachnospiraceae bacterium]